MKLPCQQQPVKPLLLFVFSPFSSFFAIRMFSFYSASFGVSAPTQVTINKEPQLLLPWVVLDYPNTLKKLGGSLLFIITVHQF